MELPGIDDPARARKQLKSTANLEFWETWFNEEVAQRVANANIAAGQAMRPDLYAAGAPADSALTTEDLRAKNPLFAVLQPERTAKTSIVGYSVEVDTGKVNTILRMPEVKAALGNDVRLLWSAKSNGNVSTCTPSKTRVVAARPSWTARASSMPASAMTRLETLSAT